MIWFDIKELERSLKADAISDKEIFYYLLVSLGFLTVAPYLVNSEYGLDRFKTLELILSLVITIIGTKMTFDVNSSGDDKDYFRRYLSLSFVIGFRLLIFAILVSIPLAIVMTFLGEIIDVKSYEQIFDTGLLLLIGLLYYYLLINSFKRVSNS